ncbi:DNA topoisomerase IB [Leifsonia sp. YIM 134122]|uniref:DNA topoisomerase n=1 Tax=Leifsonia stereocauli TaxID=3134136 RepID=A0ABU9W0P1_9MICO
MVRLRHVEPYTSPGYTRRRSGKGFRYLDGAGRTLGSEERARAEALVIPPAWTDVWIADRPNAHILAVGVDDAGRRQYIYHPDWTAARDAVKFDRMRELAAALPVARGRVTRDLAIEGLSRERILATSFRLLDLVAVRVGAEAYFEANGSFGLSTLLVRHVKLDGEVMRLAFPAKSGQRMQAEVTDAALAAVSAELLGRTPRSRYLAWQDENRFRALGGAQINEYVRTATGGDFTAKDFRTLRGTIAAASALAAAGPASSEREAKQAVRAAVVAASEVLGNTPTVAKGSYIDPTVIDRYLAGETIALTGSPENALLALYERD